ncbi:MAG: Glu-tRNA(Gln) amidotransferase GatDE subunit E, partial [Thermoplasmata archaeon]
MEAMRPFRAGLEIHQQLDTGKLFCRCPSGLREEVLGRFERRLRISAGELGEIDEAARLEALKGRTYVYEIT